MDELKRERDHLRETIESNNRELTNLRERDNLSDIISSNNRELTSLRRMYSEHLEREDQASSMLHEENTRLENENTHLEKELHKVNHRLNKLQTEVSWQYKLVHPSMNFKAG